MSSNFFSISSVHMKNIWTLIFFYMWFLLFLFYLLCNRVKTSFSFCFVSLKLGNTSFCFYFPSSRITAHATVPGKNAFSPKTGTWTSLVNAKLVLYHWVIGPASESHSRMILTFAEQCTLVHVENSMVCTIQWGQIQLCIPCPYEVCPHSYATHILQCYNRKQWVGKKACIFWRPG